MSSGPNLAGLLVNEEAQTPAQREAEQALHALLNKLAGAAAAQEQQLRSLHTLPAAAAEGGTPPQAAAPATVHPALASALRALAALLAAFLGPQLSATSLSGLNLLGSGGGGAGAGGDDDVTAGGSAVGPPARFDWLSLAPGLRPLLDSAASAVALLSGLAADVSIFLTVYVLLGAAAQVAAGPRSG
ncbi:hypothetical protein GPECTOR_6g813 [Gonium pectorale]|uniref:Uncharacterized protein n=1 Tax=Gonium pectorale TaxID=33097 RepID=A0A150GVP4_GONPE|nr:hypothetical protein GPECTOR_6g813 [Gonium pectorale]|eukprot:KXZ53895.1 hypothetical protein GPECTOR_6g813 [Gonium pectorale]